MDLKKLAYDVNEPRDYVVPDPSNDWQPSDWVVQLLSEDSDAVRSAQMRIQKRLTSTAQSGNRRQKGGGVDVNPDELRRAQLEIAVVAVKGWRGLSENGEQVPYSEETARKILSMPSMRWLLEEINTEIGDLTDFLNKSPSVTAN